MSNKKNDDYIDKYQDPDEINPVLTNSALYAPIVSGVFGILSMMGYFIALSSNDRFQYVLIIVAPVFAIKGLITSLGNISDRSNYTIYWRIGFYSCVVPLAAFLVVVLLMVLGIIPIGIS